MANQQNHTADTIRRLFTDVDTLVVRPLRSREQDGPVCTILYCDGMADTALINDFIIRPLMEAKGTELSGASLEQLRLRYIVDGESRVTMETGEIVQAICHGDTALCVEGQSGALILSSESYATRSISEPESEKVLTGPREGFNESLMVNLSMVRRRLGTNELKMKMRQMGTRSRTRVCVSYMDRLVNRDVLDSVMKKLDKIDIDGILDSNYIAELISSISLLGFDSCGFTERPDIVAGKLLEGRIAIFVDGSPVALTIPHLFIENFQSNEDYYINHYYATFSRILRILGFLMTILVPALYIAVVTHHHEIIPTPLLISIASEQQDVPLPAALEAILLLVTFDILRETGIRMPSGIGQALSIVGALVIGQSAVEAGLVSAPIIIVVAFTGITNLLVPKLNAPALLVRYGLLLLAAGFGLTGVTCGCAILVTHVFNLESFGIQQMIPLEGLRYQRIKDIFHRAPWSRMRTRISPVSGNTARSGVDNSAKGGEPS